MAHLDTDADDVDTHPSVDDGLRYKTHMNLSTTFHSSPKVAL